MNIYEEKMTAHNWKSSRMLLLDWPLAAKCIFVQARDAPGGLSHKKSHGKGPRLETDIQNLNCSRGSQQIFRFYIFSDFSHTKYLAFHWIFLNYIISNSSKMSMNHMFCPADQTCRPAGWNGAKRCYQRGGLLVLYLHEKRVTDGLFP